MGVACPPHESPSFINTQIMATELTRLEKHIMSCIEHGRIASEI